MFCCTQPVGFHFPFQFQGGSSNHRKWFEQYDRNVLFLKLWLFETAVHLESSNQPITSNN